MKKMHVVKSFSPTTKGYSELSDYDLELAIASRSVAMIYLPHYYQKGTMEEKKEGFKALVEVANMAGFKISFAHYMVGDKMKSIKKFPIYRDYDFYRELFANFRAEVNAIKYDPEDEHGLCDESVKVANLMFKYKNLIAMRMKKKNIFEKIRYTFKALFR